MGWKLTRLKTLGALTPLTLAVSALASTVPYRATDQKDPVADLNDLGNAWDRYVSEVRPEISAHGAPRNPRAHAWHHKADGNDDPGGSSSVSSTGSSVGTDDSGLLTQWTGEAFDPQPSSWPSNGLSPNGDGWENLWGGWNSADGEYAGPTVFRGLYTMRKDAPPFWDPPDPVPEPGYTVFLLAGLFAAVVFVRRYQLHGV